MPSQWGFNWIWRGWQTGKRLRAARAAGSCYGQSERACLRQADARRPAGLGEAKRQVGATRNNISASSLARAREAPQWRPRVRRAVAARARSVRVKVR